jgi:hypothetical protein
MQLVDVDANNAMGVRHLETRQFARRSQVSVISAETV